VALRVEKIGIFPQYSERCYGTSAEIKAYSPAVAVAEGFPTDVPGVWYYTPTAGWKQAIATDPLTP
jgi:hypothetical protein